MAATPAVPQKSVPLPTAPVDVNKPVVAAAASEVQPIEPNRTYPYTGQIMGNDVLVRSGAGTNYYQCGKLFQGDIVEVRGEQAGWSRIDPPLGSFSWVAMQYLGVNLKDQTSGIVTGNGVGAYAGSDVVPPMHSTEKQVILKRGDKVKLLGEEKDGYLKIACPAGSCLWVSTKFIQVTNKPKPAVGGTVMVQPKPSQPSASAAETTLEAEKLKEFYQLQDKVKAERAKPLMEQDFTAIKKPLTELANLKEAGKATRYAQRLLEQVAGCELAKQVSQEVQQQDKQLSDIKAKIETAKEQQMAQNPDLGRFSVIGKLQTSTIFSGGPQGKRFRVSDETGKTLCYAEAVGAAADLDLNSFIDQKVGLVGTIKAYPAISGALVAFTEIVKLP
jgi:uncharacterized protein YgiM (DUF1202 family)